MLKISLGTQKGTGAIGAGPTMIKPFITIIVFSIGIMGS